MQTAMVGHSPQQEKAWGALDASYKNALNDALTTGKITWNRGMDLVRDLEGYLRALDRPAVEIGAIVTPLYHAVHRFPLE
jgi:hypothetical protein